MEFNIEECRAEVQIRIARKHAPLIRLAFAFPPAFLSDRPWRWALYAERPLDVVADHADEQPRPSSTQLTGSTTKQGLALCLAAEMTTAELREGLAGVLGLGTHGEGREWLEYACAADEPRLRHLYVVASLLHTYAVEAFWCAPSPVTDGAIPIELALEGRDEALLGAVIEHVANVCMSHRLR